MQVFIFGILVEYGCFFGGVINVMMCNGGNEFCGILCVDFINNDWCECNFFEVENDIECIDQMNDVWMVMLGGCIIKD